MNDSAAVMVPSDERPGAQLLLQATKRTRRCCRRHVDLHSLLLPVLLSSIFGGHNVVHGFVMTPRLQDGINNIQNPRMMCGGNSAEHGVSRPRRTSTSVSLAAGDVLAADRTSDRERTWSNPGGKDLVQVIGNVWCAERPFVWNGIDVGGRMAVVKLSDGSLWVHSPVNLDKPLQEALEKLGPVGHIVSPNYEHVKYASQWMEAYPSASSYACPGLEEREPEVGFTREVGATPADETPPEWGGEIKACFMDCEMNPFTGKPFFNEVVFFHTPTKSLITSDLYWNYPATEIPFGTKAWKWGMDKVYLPFFKRFMVTDKATFAARVENILAWGIEIIVPCHGDVVRNGASQALRKTLLGEGSRQG